MLISAARDPRAAAMGDAGYDVAAGITWDGVIEKLTTLPESPKLP